MDSLKDLIIKAQNGNSEATEELINRLQPLIKKNSFKLGYNDAKSDLMLWILEAIHRHKPNKIWEKSEIEKHTDAHIDDKTEK